MNKVFLIDICGTIYRSNTTLDFVRFFWGDDVKVRIMLSLPFRILSRLMYYAIRWEPLRFCLIRMLKGKSHEELRIMAETFHKEFLCRRINNDVISKIEKKRQQGYTLVLLSATLDIIAEEVSKQFNIPHVISSMLDYDDDGICLGRLRRDLLHDKHGALKKEGYAHPYDGIITDNYTDASLIEKSNEAYLICYGSSREKWGKYIGKNAIERCHYIELY